MTGQHKSLLESLEALPTEIIIIISRLTVDSTFGPAAIHDDTLGWLQPLHDTPVLPLEGIPSQTRSMIINHWLETTPFYLKLLDTYTKERLKKVMDEIKTNRWPCRDADNTDRRLQHLWLRIDCTRASQRILPIFYKIRYSGVNRPFSVDIFVNKVPWGFPEYVWPHVNTVKSIVEDKLADIQNRAATTEDNGSSSDCGWSRGLSLDEIEDIATSVLLSTNADYFGTTEAVKKAWERWKKHSFL